MKSVKPLWTLILLCCVIINTAKGDKDNTGSNYDEDSVNFYSFPVMDIAENIISLEEYSGKVTLVVNVASQCGYTDGHYKMLNLLQSMFDDNDKFTVLAFPCNQFGGQEPGSSHEIFDFVYTRMEAKFPLFAKVDVINENANPAWKFLSEESGQAPTWNFWKYLVDHTGHVIKAWGPATSPDKLYPYVQDAVDAAILADASKEKKRKTIQNDNKRKNKRDEF